MNTKVLSVCLAVLAALSCASAQQRYPQILRLSSDVSPDGQFQYAYQTEDGISSEARGTPVRSSSRDADGADGPATAVTGQYSYTGPDGQVYTVSYVADENGYRASGAHLPQPPPVPEAIQQSLQLIARSSASSATSSSDSFQPLQQRAAPAAPAFQGFQAFQRPQPQAFQPFQGFRRF
ncbi:endocuticle structural glycoprotein SgAbd-2-like [Thrips palmi]|uniref:Endocuticle structural glycoprotein SgAbd-2-like n=1 Tax=Thrips palmi TaxID=161013 RepID=A0A6P8ZX79_THRPL|nr:endocuticle structural glycoprotein SgAbd-2-like [Thrips palmi]